MVEPALEGGAVRRAVVVCALALLACSGPQRAPQPGHGVVTPLGVDAGVASASASPGGATPDLDLETFAPLLALPALAPAAAALEAGTPGLAARQVEAALGSQPLAPAEALRWQLLLARLREAAGELEGAAQAYDLAARESWPLTRYAALGAARVLVRAGHHEAALERLERVPLEPPIAEEARLLLADVAIHTGHPELAVQTWRDHLASGAEPQDAATVALLLAEALFERTTRPSEPAGGSLDAGTPPQPGADSRAELIEALDLARRVRLRYVEARELGARAAKLEAGILAALPEADRKARQLLSPAERLSYLRGLEAANMSTLLAEEAESLTKSLRRSQRWGPVGCEAQLLHAKGLGLDRRYGKAADLLAPLLQNCHDEATDELRVRALYLAGKYSARDGRHTAAVHYYEQLEQEAPDHRLADDARLNAALSYYSLGVEARFTELLSRMPDDYPRGDMMLDGVFRLALRRMEKSDWSGAASVLDRAASVMARLDVTRGVDFSGRERYWRARAWMETGERARGLDELAAIVRDLPFSYYMLQAYTRLDSIDRKRAEQAQAEGIQRSREQPFHIEHQPEFDAPGFERALELLRVGDVPAAQAEIDVLRFADPGTAPSILWGISLLYAKAGATQLSHRVARNLLTDWLGRWPAGDWTQAWELAFPRPYLKLVELQADRNAIAPYLAYGIMREESAFDPKAKSPADAYGLMQLIVPTARAYGKKANLPWSPAALTQPAINIALGCLVLGDLEKRFDDNPLLAIPGYNAGPGRPRSWLKERPGYPLDLWVELIPFRETRRYMKRVLASRATYAFLYYPEAAQEVIHLPLNAAP